MKAIKYTALGAVLSFSIAACTNNNRDSATLGGTRDTSNVTAGSNAGGVNAAESGDTSNNGNKNRGKDSTSNGNANPTGRLENDTINQNRNHRPR
ncbi:hypothetical protein MUY27_12115 [Mucilaginibacter sp. RS28]|uniref:Lipoprotein n=1 Tax=Mucilaginibacter straminoryzae TaxID=2932774 RepID=A0A9X2BDL7_9SPHI|nr:hypothetical protein [Mucilaginibacter straminoryzae]MCJ8210453.1 hypothetical protein [Mucilaginibacter straminoryzae]